MFFVQLERMTNMKHALYAFMLLLCGCSLFWPDPAQEEDRIAIAAESARICSMYRDSQKDRADKKVRALFESAVGKNVYFCDANPATQTCVTNAIRMNAKVGATDTLIELSKAKLLTVNPNNNFMFFDYYFNVNHTYPACRAASTSLNFLDCDNAVWVTMPFQCDFSFTEKTSISMVYRITYVNFVQKEIGVVYKIRAMGASQGSRSGYALIRFPSSPKAPAEESEDTKYMKFIVDANGNMVSYEPLSFSEAPQETYFYQQ